MKFELKYLCRNIAIGAAIFTTWGCNMEEDKTTLVAPPAEASGQDDAKAAKVREYILSLGISPENIESKDGFFVVGGDLAFDKNLEYGGTGAPSSGALAKGQQYVYSSQVSALKSRNIRVQMHSSMSEGGSMTAVNADLDKALLTLNRTFSSLHFERVTSSPHTTISRGGTADGMGSWPVSGNPGATITFRDGGPFFILKGHDFRVRSLVHELMHNIGVLHSREGNNATGQFSNPGGTLVPNTPVFSNPDLFSIMNPWDWMYDVRNPKEMGWENCISAYDHMTVQYMYPYWSSQKSGDVNGDGKTDIIRIATNNAVSFRLSNGTGLGGTVSAGSLGDPAGQYLVGDINGDGRSDLMFSKNGTITIRYSTGNGFGSTQTLVTGFGNTTGGGQYHILDFNGDGRKDVMFINFSTRAVNVRLSNGTSLGSNIQTAFGTYASQYFIGDFNGDGRDDVLNASRPLHLDSDPTSINTHSVSIVYSNGNSFGASQQLICGDCFGHISWSGMYMSGDYNIDGKDDIYFKDANGNVIVALSTGSALGTMINTNGVGAAMDNYFSADFNGDGRTDVISLNRSGGIKLMRSNGTSPGTVSNIISSGFGSLSAGDQFL